MAHVTVLVPDGHTIQVHPPSSVAPPHAGMVHDPMAMGAKAAMDSAVPTPEQAPIKADKSKKIKPVKEQPKRK